VRVFGYVTVFFIVFSAPALAECTPQQDAQLRALSEQFASLKREARKVVSRADGQELRIIGLPEAFRSGLAPLPASPSTPDGFSPDDKATIDCDANNFDQQALSLTADLEAANAALSVYEEAVNSREGILVVAEDGDETADGALTAQADTTMPEEAPDAVTDPETPAAVAQDDDQTDKAPDVVQAPEGSATAQASSRVPLADPDNPYLFRRVISLPASLLRENPGGSDADARNLPVFSVLYVFDESNANGETWLEVGPSLLEGAQGWIKTDSALDWTTMLVMQFAPKGRRSDVLFFDDVTTLTDIVSSPFYEASAAEYYERLRTQRDKMRDDSDYRPDWDNELVAVEPQTGVTFQNDPYILPILDWQEEAFDGVVDTILLRVAAVPAQASGITTRDDESFSSDPQQAASLDDEFRIGVVFVMDTTISMRPFIERTYQTVEQFFNAFERFESSAFISFGLVGFRDYIEQNESSLEYVTRVFQPLDPEASSRQVLTNMRQMTEASAPTLGFEEDGFAGIRTAIEEMDWSPFDARLIIYVTDASAREGSDQLAFHRNMTPASIAEIARQNNIAVVPIHLLTPTNERLGDIAIAEAQYREMSETGVVNIDKYIAVDAQSDTEFGDALDGLANSIVQEILTINAGQLASAADMEPIPESVQGDDAPADRLSNIVAAEIFRAQLESLATVGDGDAPAFLSGWASDRDLVDPDVRTLEVSVFLTRNQLSTLDKRLDLIVGAYTSGGDDPEAFFDQLQLLAAEVSTDPDAAQNSDREAIETILPGFLKNLPYRSEVLGLDRDYWASLGNSARTEFIERIRAKRQVYQETFDSSSLWRDFGANDPGLEATPIRITNLP
jgi:serine/threonine-protein kinase PpkA